MKRGLANAGPKPHPTTNFRSSRFKELFTKSEQLALADRIQINLHNKGACLASM